MLQFFLKKYRFLKSNLQPSKTNQQDSENRKMSPLTGNLDKDLQEIKARLGHNNDLILRKFFIDFQEKVEASIILLDELTDKRTIDDHILRPLMSKTYPIESIKKLAVKNIIEYVEHNIVTAMDVRDTRFIEEIIDGILSGDTVLLIDGQTSALIISSRGWQTRSIEEPDTDAVVRGPREGFVETLRINTAMLRRKIKDPNLTFEYIRLGRRTKTDIYITYVKGIANPKLVEEVKRRINRVDVDSILESGILEEYIEDAPFSPFPTISISEKPDMVAAKILEGRVAIMTDGTPIVLTVPALFVENFQSGDDYYTRPYYSTLIRILRYIAFTASVFLPSVYVAATTFHQELVPTSLLYTMAAAREGTPFPAFVEAMVIGAVYEIIREASVRMPRPIGEAVSIVGALVIGEAAVTAGLIGAPMIIIVAVTGISSFVVPTLLDVGALLRIFFGVLSATMGFFGIIIGALGLFIHLASIRSFGVPYLSPIAPVSVRDLKDVFVRVPMWAMFTRPRSMGWHDPQRQEFRLMPGPEEEGDHGNKGDVN